MLGLDYAYQVFFVVDVEVKVGFVVGIEFVQKMRLDDGDSHVGGDVLDECLFVVAVLGEDVSLEEDFVIRDEQRNGAIGVVECWIMWRCGICCLVESFDS